MAWAAALAVAVRGVSGSINSLTWLRTARTDHPTVSAQPFIVLILPLLREQRILADTVEYFTGLAKQHGHGVV